MLITRPNHDITTHYLYFWSDDIIHEAKRRGNNVIDLAGKRASLQEFSSILKKLHPSFIVLNGHGNERTVTGYDNEPLVEEGVNEFLLKGAVIYARSCRSARRLGPASILKGAFAYIGYTDDFVFLIDEAKITRPKQDKTAELFLTPANHVAISLLKGHDAGTAQMQSKNIYKRTIQKLMTSETPKEEKELIPYLLWDMQHQTCLGDQHATI